MCTVVRVFPSSSRNRWNAIIRGSFVSTKSTSSARFLRASSSFPGLIFAVPTYTNAPDIASSLLSQAALPPDGAGTVVQELVSRLRRAFHPGRAKGSPSELLQTVGKGYRLAADPESIDANRFKRFLDEARRASPWERSAKLSDALGLWRGPALADFTYEPFAQRAIAALEELRIQAIEDRFEAELALGRFAELVADLEEAIAGYPFRERLRGFLMLALYRAGRQTEALEAYRRTRSLLNDELGLEP